MGYKKGKFGWVGLDCIGLDCIGLDWIQLNSIRIE